MVKREYIYKDKDIRGNIIVVYNETQKMVQDIIYEIDNRRVSFVETGLVNALDVKLVTPIDDYPQVYVRFHGNLIKEYVTDDEE